MDRPGSTAGRLTADAPGPTSGWFGFETGLAIAVAGVLLVEHLAFGGDRVEIALWFSLVQIGLLAIGLLSPALRAALKAFNGWWTLFSLFLLLLVGVASSLAPFGVERTEPWVAVGREPVAAVDPLGVFVEVAKLMGLGSVFTLAGLLCVRRRWAGTLMSSLIASGLAFGLVCLVLESLSATQVLGWTKPVIAQGRVSGLFSSANTAATLFGLSALLAAGGVLRAAEQLTTDRPLNAAIELIRTAGPEIACFLVNIGCLLLSSSRGGIAAFAPSLALLLIWRSSKTPSKSLRRSAATLGVLAIGLVLVSGGLAFDRYTHAAVMRDQRFSWAVQAWRLFQEAPFHGYGLGSLPLMFSTNATPATYWTLGWAGAAHNVYLQWLAETGLLGFIPLTALITFSIDAALLGLTGADPAAAWRRTLLACVIFVGLHSLVEYSLQEPSIAATFAVLMGAGIGLSSQRRRLRRGRLTSAAETDDLAAAQPQGTVRSDHSLLGLSRLVDRRS